MLHCTQRGFEKVCFQAGIVGQKRKKTKKTKTKVSKKVPCHVRYKKKIL